VKNMADTLKYGWAYGGRQGVEMKVGGSHSFSRLGGAFVAASGTGSGLTVMVPVTASTDAIIGWAEVPRSAVPGLNDFDPTAVFAMPAQEAIASLTASLVGINMSASASGSGTTLVQRVLPRQTTTMANAQFMCMGVDTDSKTGRKIYVRVNPHHIS
jgi:hypothetical protein